MAGIALEVKTEILAKVKGGEKVVELSKQYGVSILKMTPVEFRLQSERRRKLV